ncbi:MAG: prolyl aminopeptidase [Candidatus Dormiibacterota bacterium]
MTGAERLPPYEIREPFATHQVEVGDGHTLYVEEVGDPRGVPAVFLHGGPGGGSTPEARGFFDPDRYHTVLLDQRGAGRSTPHADLVANTTWHLVRDLETIRERLGIERWLVFGGSWGSTLALAYAQTHPERVTGLVLRGIFLLRRRELLWLYQRGASDFHPEEWARFVEPIPLVERGDLLLAFERRFNGADRDLALRCAKAWSRWEAACSHLLPDPEFVAHLSEDRNALAFAQIENHYFVNGGFLDHPDQLLDGVARIRQLPAVIVQGRHDLVCPPVSAFDLAARWPEADLRVVADAGHSAHEPGLTSELVRATNAFADQLG